MPVSVDEFIAVLSGGKSVSSDLVRTRDQEIVEALAVLATETARLAQAGLESTTLSSLQANLDAQRRAALAANDNAARYAALKPVAKAAKSAAAGARHHADEAMAHLAERDKLAAQALQATTAIAAAIAAIPDQGLREPLERNLADLQDDRVALATITSATALPTATTGLKELLGRIAPLASQVQRVASMAEERQSVLRQADGLLGQITRSTGTLAQPPRDLLAQTAAARTQRDGLASAVMPGLEAALAGAAKLLAELAALRDRASALTPGQISPSPSDVAPPSTTVSGRSGISVAPPSSDIAPLPTAVGGRSGIDVAPPSTDVTPPATLPPDTQPPPPDTPPPPEDVTTPTPPPSAADTGAPPSPPADASAKTLAERLRADPGAAERELLASGFEQDKFDGRLNLGTTQAQSTGEDITYLSEAEIVAVYSYTTEDYTNMNRLALNLPFLDEDPITHQPCETRPKVLEVLNEITKIALSKLPSISGIDPATGKPNKILTHRGEGAWPGWDKQYVEGQSFKCAAFWSTSTSAAFNFKLQISISGSSGKSVKHLSAVPSEDEVLYPPGTEFKVLKREDVRDPQGDLVKSVIVVEEV